MSTRDPRDEPDAQTEAGHERDDPPAPTHPLELALRHGLRYSGLRDVALDPRLLLYVPLELCEQELVLPLGVSDECLELATATPDPDTDLVEQRFPALELELVIAPAEHIAERLEELKAVR